MTSIDRGNAGTFTVQVWSQDWTVASVPMTLELSTLPSDITPAFTAADSGICKPAATTSPVECTMPIPVKQDEVLQVQVPVASTATSVSQVALRAAALPATAAAKLAGTLAVTETAQVTSTTQKKSSSPSSSKSSTASSSKSSSSSKDGTQTPGQVGTGSTGLGSIGVGQLPELNGASSSLIGAGNASGLFPEISPSSSPSPVPGSANGADGANGKHIADPPSKIALLPLGMPVATAQVIGLIALALAFLLALTRLSVRRSRRATAKPRSQTTSPPAP